MEKGQGRLKTWLLFFLMALPACADTSDTVTIRFPHAVNDRHPRVMASRLLAQRLREETEGRVELRLFAGGQLYGARQSVNAAAVGDVEMAMEPETHFVSFDPVFKVVDWPFFFENDETFRRFLSAELAPRVTDSLRSKGLVLLGLWDEGPMVLASRDKVLRRPEDYEGVKIRSSGHEILARCWNELGAATIRLPIEEMYSALERGVSDAVYTTLYTFVTGGLHEVAPKVLLWPSRATYVWVMNAEAWSRLDTSSQQTLERLAERASEEYHESLRRGHEARVRAITEAKGGELVTLTPAEAETLRKRLLPLLVSWRQEHAIVFGDLIPE